MQLTAISIDSFLQIKALDMKLDSVPVHLIVGHNECGKTSVHEAIRFGILGETERVSLKRDYPQMIRSGSKVATVRIDYVDGGGDHDFVKRDVATGKVVDGYQGEPEFAVAEVMDATKYPYYDGKHQRTMLSRLLEITIDKEEVRVALARRGIPEEYVGMVLPMLRAGFDAAHKEAKTKQSDARSKWEMLTGEKWGTQKGADWKPKKRPVMQPAIEAKEREVQRCHGALQKSLEKIGEIKAHQGGFGGPCPACGEKLVWSGHHLKLFADEPTPGEVAAHGDAQREADQLNGLYTQELAALNQLKVDLDFNNFLSQTQENARALHAQIMLWLQTAEALAPDGIPGQIIADKLKPINDRLRETSIMTTWDQVVITPLMNITVGLLPYSLCSESSQWRAQAAIAEAISYIGKIGIICLDRLDVLDFKNRSRLLRWVHDIADNHQTILLFGTLKTPPEKLPSTMQLHWLEDGRQIN